MVEVFWCSCAADPLRKALADATYIRWAHMPVELHKIIGQPGAEFQGERRRQIEQQAKGDIYILADDDCLPLGKDFVDVGLSQMRNHPDYAVLGASVHFATRDTPEVFESNSAGGINFTRKGLIEVPQFDGHAWDDTAQTAQLKAKGWKTGYMRDVRMNHLGHGLSTLWPDYYTGVTQVG